MKQCHQCGQLLTEKITPCPTCGRRVSEGIQAIDNYRILAALREGYSSVVYHAVDEKTQEEVALRIFTPQSGMDAKMAALLTQELAILKKLPQDYFVQPLAIKQSTTGLWYRVSEWIDVKNWEDLLTSDHFKDNRTFFQLFHRLAATMQSLHKHGHIIPHLILNDIIIFNAKKKYLAVKIDYKVSRFLDSRLDRPGPQLKHLLSVHPDIINNRPLNVQSDIWSLGKIFVELLTGDFSGEIDYLKKVDQLAIPAKAKVLLKAMLANNPDERPASMAQISLALSQLSSREVVSAQRKGPGGANRRPKGRAWLTALLWIVPVILGIAAWYYITNIQRKETTLSDYANRYARSIAFVMVDYQLMVEDLSVYHNHTAGTAFPADSKGYFLTSRHVACPWLGDPQLFQMLARMKRLGHSPRLHYRIFLWFNGQQVFKPLPQLDESIALEDRYYLETAYSLGGPMLLRIAGVPRPPVKTWPITNPPLRDDFAVLKIDPVPPKLTPLPLARQSAPMDIPQQTPVIVLGFPWDSHTQSDRVKTSFSTGHVLRTFDDLFQVDTSIDQGNGGGPVVDSQGQVVGIDASVYVEMTKPLAPEETSRSEIGLVLPINRAAAFLAEIKAGQPHWNGDLDLAIEETLE